MRLCVYERAIVRERVCVVCVHEKLCVCDVCVSWQTMSVFASARSLSNRCRAAVEIMVANGADARRGERESFRPR